MIKKLDPEKELMKLLGEPEPKKYELIINSNYMSCMEVQYWSALRKTYKNFKVVDDLPNDIFYIKRERREN